MYLIKKIGLAALAISFCFGSLVISASAQNNRGDGQNRGNQRNWQNQGNQRNWQNRGNGRGRQDGNRWGGRINQREGRNLRWQRNRIFQTRNRFYRNDGRISWWERQRLNRR